MFKAVSNTFNGLILHACIYYILLCSYFNPDRKTFRSRRIILLFIVRFALFPKQKFGNENSDLVKHKSGFETCWQHVDEH